MTSLVGHPAPNIKAKAVYKGKIEEVCLKDHLGKYIVLFFYPLNFTFVCPTEILALNSKLSEFKEKNAEVWAISVDSVYSHLAWMHHELKGIQFHLVSDMMKTISLNYGVLNEDGLALRGTFIIDPEGIVQVAHHHNLPLGRNIDEILRLIDAHQHVVKYGEVCPADWTKGKPAIKVK